MKHCKTLLVLVAATIVMLTSGCSRQTVHPVPIRYNFLDQIPDADPMLLDTDFVSGTFPVPGDTLPVAASAVMKYHPAPIRYRFAVPTVPDHDPMLQAAESVAEAFMPFAGPIAARKTPVGKQ
ncbi:hypothetical protein [Chitinophaga sp.]|uniref:hypothetical protein n=1 Tax=Chitinophaga sp. TaxID=1869181 RepID=UPI00261E82AE|nr:hypothetical protein [uncultured Chitinophaga sp.]